MKRSLGLMLLALFTVWNGGCGGNDITFPQGPTSGIDGLGFFNQVIHIEPDANFNLQAQFNSSTERFEFSWDASPDHTCVFYRLIIVLTPFPPDPGVNSVTQVLDEGDTAGLTAIASEELTTLIQTSMQPHSALVLCFEDADAPLSTTVFPRSDFSFLSGFF